MSKFLRVPVALAIGGLVYLAGWFEAGHSNLAVILAVAAAAVAAFALHSDRIFRSLDVGRFLGSAVGVCLGVFAGSFLSELVFLAGYESAAVAAFLYAVVGAVVGSAGYHAGAFLKMRIAEVKGAATEGEAGRSRPKLLDTSVIIDGRILDIAETKFVDGPFVIPNFVLREIQLISDSADAIKRNRGRRGLDMLNKLQQRSDIVVKISYLDYADTREVDAKLIRAALDLDAQLVTNDFNLNKVAELQGVEVLNLNTLTNALKPVVLPGEDIVIDIIKEGKDENQGIGYLEDGTMVVVENGGSMVNKKVRVNVTSIIQTAAGKMIFTRAQAVIDDADDRPGRDDDRRGDRGGKRGGQPRRDDRRDDRRPRQDGGNGGQGGRSDREAVGNQR